MSSPTKEDLRRVDDSLKNELISEHKLKHVDVQEKVVLPSQTEIEQEKDQQQFLKSIETFPPEKLQHIKTQEKNPLPTKEAIEEEKKTLA